VVQPLDLLAFGGIDGVARPDPVGTFQHPEIDPAAAGRARLDLQARVPGPQLVQEPVDRQRVPVHPGHAGRLVTGVDQVTVVVPFEVADVVLGEQRVQPLQEVGVDLGPAEVENLLEA
jgi:hypothetical protein